MATRKDRDPVEYPSARLSATRTTLAELARLGRWSEANKTVLDTLGLIQAGPAGVTAPELAGLVYIAGGPRPDPARRIVGERVAVPDERPASMRALLLVNRIGDRDEAVATAEAVLASPGRREVGTFWHAILTLVYSDRVDIARDHCEQAAEDPAWTQTPRYRDALTLLRARLAYLDGEPLVAVGLFSRLLAGGVFPQLHSLAVAWTVAALVDFGEVEDATELLHQHGFDGVLTDAGDRAELLWARGLLQEAAGRPQAACEEFLSCGRELLRWAVINPAVIPWRSAAARCARAVDRTDLAVALAREELMEAHRWGTASAVGKALWVDALVSEDPATDELLRTAAELLEQSGEKYEIRHVLYTLGSRLNLEGRFDEGEQALLGAREIARQTGNKYCVECIDAVLELWRPDGPFRSLSTQEFRVAHLARSGFSNKEIAERMHVALRTVELYLSTVYRKLGISRRSGLASTIIPRWGLSEPLKHYRM
ncbi:helix-turn-helix transcriptional regulator [Amycolatopsis sp. WQ 127309]|uniref:helix-turn-helix domain-containing protein n=1 Tax=Amycolatopsis sp. WQ 127309 TaxID=2932773 RepID=UPI001FF160EA|nr:helix-turn-helix transcriptional regulator [Amycolatopsis sp. WQ 127309]UOZ06896.1 LuxR C-terminal-related transcriptional regulator [Amycolatopsis sp. WQ 127309]